MNLALDFTWRDSVVSQARTWGFICQCQGASWLIFPRQTNQRWKLQQVENRWILSVGDVPQLYLHSQEASSFLKHHRLKS